MGPRKLVSTSTEITALLKIQFEAGPLGAWRAAA
jgi:hypothetical protein